jgi:hypothetical protein
MVLNAITEVSTAAAAAPHKNNNNNNTVEKETKVIINLEDLFFKRCKITVSLKRVIFIFLFVLEGCVLFSLNDKVS